MADNRGQRVFPRRNTTRLNTTARLARLRSRGTTLRTIRSLGAIGTLRTLWAFGAIRFNKWTSAAMARIAKFTQFCAIVTALAASFVTPFVTAWFIGGNTLLTFGDCAELGGDVGPRVGESSHARPAPDTLGTMRSLGSFGSLGSFVAARAFVVLDHILTFVFMFTVFRGSRLALGAAVAVVIVVVVGTRGWWFWRDCGDADLRWFRREELLRERLVGGDGRGGNRFLAEDVELRKEVEERGRFRLGRYDFADEVRGGRCCHTMHVLDEVVA